MAVSAADKKKLGKWIKQLREKQQPHLSQRQLALAVDITNASLSSIESGMIFPSEALLLKLIEQLQPPPELREKMLTLFAEAKGTSPPDINAELSKKPKLWGLIRKLIEVDPSEEQVSQIEQLICAGVSASGGIINDIE
jgi:transcriptional regulator with XRE-family HTH domain